jgi:hypothetical protein
MLLVCWHIYILVAPPTRDCPPTAIWINLLDNAVQCPYVQVGPEAVLEPEPELEPELELELELEPELELEQSVNMLLCVRFDITCITCTVCYASFVCDGYFRWYCLS